MRSIISYQFFYILAGYDRRSAAIHGAADGPPDLECRFRAPKAANNDPHLEVGVCPNLCSGMSVVEREVGKHERLNELKSRFLGPNCLKTVRKQLDTLQVSLFRAEPDFLNFFHKRPSYLGSVSPRACVMS